MRSNDRVVAVTSRSFSRHPILRQELLKQYEHVRFNDEASELRGDALVAFLKGCEMAITSLEPIAEPLLAALPQLRVISKFGVGLDMLDLAAMRRHGVRLAWSPGINRRSVAELTVGLMICALRRIAEANWNLREGHWRQIRGRELSSQTVGIIGYGNIGKEVARLLCAFGSRLLAYDIRPEDDRDELPVERVDLETLLAESDVVTIHVPLAPSTRNLLDRDRLSRLKRDSVLINTARGGLVDEQALKKLLIAGHVAGAAFDVFSHEPPEDQELLLLPNFLATPHIGGSTEEAILEMGRSAIDGLKRARLPDEHMISEPTRW